MSLYKSSSLAMIPTAYKDGKLYSIRPTDGSGDFTFSRGSNLAATRVASSGYIEKGRENLLLQSNNFDTTWVNELGGTPVLSGGQAGYDATNDAWLVGKGAEQFKRISQSVSSSGVWTFSVYAKANTQDSINLRDQTNGKRCEFDLINGVITFKQNEIDAQMIDVGGGWYRCSVTFNQSTSLLAIYIGWSDFDAGSVYLQDSQLEAGLVATSVIESGASTGKAGILEDMPRLDYSGGATCPSLLLEPQRSNLVTHSEYFGDSSWTNFSSSITTNALISPEGVQNAVKLVENTANATHQIRHQAVTIGNTNYASTSVFVKAGERSVAVINLSNVTLSGNVWKFDLTAETATLVSFGTGWDNVGANITSVGNDWYRCVIFGQLTSTATQVYTQIRLNNGTTNTYLGDGTSGLYLYGAQVEVGSYPTSYIPTFGSAVTRSVDSCLATSVSDLIGQTQGTMFFEIDQPYADGVNGAWSISDGSSTNRLTMNTLDVNTTTFTLSIATNYAGGSTNVISTNTTYGLHKVAIQYSETTLKIFVDGVEANSGSTDGFGNYTNFYIGANQVGTGGDIRQFKQAVLFPTALTDSECIALTTL